MASLNTSVENAQRWREHIAKNPKNKDKYPDVNSFLKDFPTPAKNYAAAEARKKNNAAKKTSFKNRVKGMSALFGKIGSRFSRKKTAKESNRNYVKGAQVEELNAQVVQLKNVLARQIENAGSLNMDEETKKQVQANIETTRSLIEARQQEMTTREQQEKLETLKKNLGTVGNVVSKAPNSSSTSGLNANSAALKKAAINAIGRMSNMGGIEAQIAELKKMIEGCCKDGLKGNSSSGPGNNNKKNNKTNTVSGATSNLFEPEPMMPPRGSRPAPSATNRAPNLFEPSPKMPPRGSRPTNAAANNEPSPAGLFGSNNFEEEPATASTASTASAASNASNNNAKTDYEYFGLDSSTATPAQLKKIYKDLALKAHPNKNPNNKNAEAKFKNLQMRYERLLKELEGRGAENVRNYNEYSVEDLEALLAAAANSGENANKIRAAIQRKRNAEAPAAANGNARRNANALFEGLNNNSNSNSNSNASTEYSNAESMSLNNSATNRSNASNSVRENTGSNASNSVQEEDPKYAANRNKRAARAQAKAEENQNVSPSGLFGSNNFENEPARSNNAASVNSVATNNRAAANALTMNSLSENEKQRVKLFKELNNSLTNKEVLNMIRNERQQTNRNLGKDYQKKRQTSRGKRGKTYKGGKRLQRTTRRVRRNGRTTSLQKKK